jgi:hypothetical protein
VFASVRSLRLRCAATIVAGALLCGCGPDFWAFSSVTSTGQGATLVVVWKDSPVDDVDRLWVALDRVELLGGEGPVVLLAEREEHDMLSLQNGARVAFDPEEVPEGTYSALRLTFAPPSAGRHRVEVGGETHPLRFAQPGGDRLELAGPFSFADGESLRWVLDLNARLSVYEAAGEWWFDPHVFRTTDDPAREVVGVVRGPSGLAVPGATVSAQANGLEVSSCRTRADGTWELGPLPAGSYAFVATAPGPLASASVVRQVPGVALPVELVLGGGGAPGSAAGSAPPGLVAGVVRVFAGGLFLGQVGVDPLTGDFDLPSLSPGLYTFELHDALGAVDVLSNLSVVSGGVTPVVFGP